MCTPIRPGTTTAAWVLIATVGPLAGPASFPVGAKHAYPKSYTAAWTAAWAEAATASVATGFSFSGAFPTSVAAVAAGPIAAAVSTAFGSGRAANETHQFAPGVVWQLQISVSDQCGKTTVYTGSLIQSGSEASTPCCLPGHFADLTQAHGACSAGDGGEAYDVCIEPPGPEPQTSAATAIEIGAGGVTGLLALAAAAVWIYRRNRAPPCTTAKPDDDDNDVQLLPTANYPDQSPLPWLAMGSS